MFGNVDNGLFTKKRKPAEVHNRWSGGIWPIVEVCNGPFFEKWSIADVRNALLGGRWGIVVGFSVAVL
ncbi:MAG: hypothetical protein ACI8UO_001087 [Verrucomicrobiales bacterium]